VVRGFNPRPAFRSDATPNGLAYLAEAGLFQSSSGLSTGRYGLQHGVVHAAGMFQSSPGLSTGRYPITSRQPMLFKRFQSSPGLSTGRYDWAGIATSRPRLVSILARPFDRTLQTLTHGRQRFKNVSILARPFDRTLLARWCCKDFHRSRFNPRPAFRPDATSCPA